MAVLEAVEDIHVLPPPAAPPRKKGAPPGPPPTGEAPLHFVTAGESGLLACWDAHSRCIASHYLLRLYLPWRRCTASHYLPQRLYLLWRRCPASHYVL